MPNYSKRRKQNFTEDNFFKFSLKIVKWNIIIKSVAITGGEGIKLELPLLSLTKLDPCGLFKRKVEKH